ncbi:UNVERIFIED_CONTAM: hypothetical protein RMT77_013175 [Armadillidium vulgare]
MMLPLLWKITILLLALHKECHGRAQVPQHVTVPRMYNATMTRQRRSVYYDRDLAEMTGPEIIHSRGYPIEVHKVMTKDGYILEMHRIKGPHKSYRGSHSDLPGYGRAVYVQHCVLCSSLDFVLNDPHQALAYVLADAGFDVWLGNYRGNVYSRKHIHLSPEDTKFWKFSFMEMAHYDIPAMVYFILENTGHENVSYIGHSMGTTGLFAANSLMPQLNEKIRVMAALAPVAYLDHIRGPMRHLFQLAKYSYHFKEKFNKAEVRSISSMQASLAKTFCKPGSFSFFINVCQAILPGIVGGPNRGYIHKKYLPIVLSNTPAGTSARTLAHLGQLVDAGAFQMFDYGPKMNKQLYGTRRAPAYQLSKTMIPVGLFWSDNDWVSTPEDVKMVARDLPNVALNYRVPQEDFNHLDFLHAVTAKEVLYNRLVQFLLEH